MSGEVLYRKWRPPRFADIVGQGPVTQTLSQAIATDRTSHAYLLCGPRGTGKTSTARVLAKALNCTMRPPGVGDPCGACPSCLAIEVGNFVDLIEIDAASHGKLDEMRELTEKARFSPTQGKYKVYIIDEAHGLTSHAFDAFLKTLEEPPPQSVFVLATTEPHGLPATIVSRCQRFDFRRIASSDVVDRLVAIASAESVNVSPEVLRTIARSAGGSLRDATNLLDQLITAFGANVSIEQVRELLGIGGEDRAVALVKHLLTGNTTAALELINTVAAEGQDLRPLHRMTVDFLRAALLMKSGVNDALELPKEAAAEISFATANASIDFLLRALRMFGQITLKYDQPSPLPLELATVELGLDPAPTPVAAAPVAQATPSQQAPTLQAQRSRPASTTNVSPQPQPQQAPAPQVQPSQPAPTTNVSPQPQPQQASAPQAPPPRAAEPAPAIDPSMPAAERLVAQWPSILRALSRVPRRRFDVAALLRSSVKREIDGSELVVQFTHTSNSERLQDELDDARCRNEVEKILSGALGEGFTLRIEAGDERKTSNLNADQPGHLVRAAMSLGGQVIQKGAPAPPTAELSLASVATPSPATVANAMPEPIVEPAPPKPMVDATPKPIAEPASTSEPVAESAPDPFAEPAPASMADAAPEDSLLLPFGASQPIDPPSTNDDAPTDPYDQRQPIVEPVAVGAQTEPIAQAAPELAPSPELVPLPAEKSPVAEMDPGLYPGPEQEDPDE